ncbi:MAG: polysaccharide biosynthesis tyrosine autokinase [Ruminococcus sp.]|nr:polysaccharide biosynthesis tyrosine autokinase [Ruminococcus sp.]
MQDKQEELSLKDIFGLLLSKLWFIIILTVLGLAIAFSISKFVMPVLYRSSISMYVKSNANKTQTNVNLNEINASKSLVETYIVVLKNPSVLKEVSNELINMVEENDDLSEEKLRKCFKVTSEGTIDPNSILSCVSMASSNGTEVLELKATTKDADVSAALCNAYSKVAPSVLVRVVGAGSVETIGEAEPNYSAVSPRTKINCIIGMAGGMFLAVVIVILADLFDNSIKSSDDITIKAELPVIGEIDRFGTTKKVKGEAPSTAKRYTILDPDTPFYVNESYKAMRTNIRFALAASTSRNKNVFAVASANPSEGKSTTAANIAITLAQMDCKVLLVDADLRKPVQHRIFKENNKKGLTNVLVQEEIYEDCVKRDVIPNLDLLTTGTKPPNPSELLASDYTADVLSAMSKLYDYVIIDTPPVNVVSDAMVISRSIAGVLLVLKYGSTTFEDLKEATRRAELSNTNIIGCVLNGIKRSGGVHSYNYKYKYKSYYSSGYGSSPQKRKNDAITERD